MISILPHWLFLSTYSCTFLLLCSFSKPFLQQKWNSEEESFSALESYGVSVALFKSEIAKGKERKKWQEKKKKASLVPLHSAKGSFYLAFLSSAMEFSSVGGKKEKCLKADVLKTEHLLLWKTYNWENSVFPCTTIWMINRETVPIILWITLRSGRIWLIAMLLLEIIITIHIH